MLELFVNTMQSGSETKLAKCRGKNCSTLISHKWVFGRKLPVNWDGQEQGLK